MERITLSSLRPTVAEVDLARFQRNVERLRKAAPNSKLLAVIKSNAYGHGIAEIGRAAVGAGADRLGVTTVEEGILLREQGITIPIQLLSAVMPEDAGAVVDYDLIASVSSVEFAEALSEAAGNAGKIAPVHLKIDTGLHRFGVFPEEAVDFCKASYHLPNIEWEGIYTHFSNADAADWDTTEKQFSLFQRTITELADENFHFPLHHCGGSTITIERKDMHLDMVRPGIALFGYQPHKRQEEMISLEPVIKLKTKILQIKEIPAGSRVGYGETYVKDPTTLAIVPMGLGDGFQRSLSNKGEMLVSGQRAKILGTISLDQTLIDITSIPNVKAGDEVVLLGKQGDGEISAREIADWMNSIVDEVLGGLTDRVRREYKGEPI